MKATSIRWRIAIPYMLLIIITMVGIGWFLTDYLEELYLNNLEGNLLNQAKLISDFLGRNKNFEKSARLDSYVDIWSNSLETRITLIDLDGNVLAESYQDKDLMENHSNRPEIIEAFDKGIGTSIRFSKTLGDRFYYLATPINIDNKSVGVSRIAIPIQTINNEISQIQGTLLGITVFITVIAIIIAVVIADRSTKPINELTNAANEISSGDLNTAEEMINSISSTTIEIIQLTKAFKAMVSKIDSQIAALESEEKKMSAVLGVMNDGIVIVDDKGMVQLVNEAAKKMFDVVHKYQKKNTLIEVLRQHEINELWQKCLVSSQTESIIIDLPVKGINLQCIATPLERALPGRILLLFQDFTQIRKLETVRQDFISNISHELRTPLASLKALAETLQEGAFDDPPAAKHFLQLMETEVDALSLMVSELLELSRIESGKVPLKMHETSPVDIINQSVDRLSLQAERAGLNVITYSDSDLPNILVDESRLEQVLVNLLHNAIKFTPTGGEIIVSVEKQSNHVLFSIQDTGIGIPASDLPRIFERFYKTDRSRASGGTGLGLAISRHIVETHNGKIYAKSIEGLGSTFYFTIPVIKENS